MDGFVLGLPLGGDRDPVEPAGSGGALAGVSFAEAPYGTREPRCAVGGTVEVGGIRLVIIATHLAYAGAGQRALQAEALLTMADGWRAPLVVLGDLNAAIEAPELRDLASDLVDAFGAVGIPPGDPARHSCGPQAIDHILVRGLTVDACRVVTQAGDASDHLPVVATLRAEVG